MPGRFTGGRLPGGRRRESGRVAGTRPYQGPRRHLARDPSRCIRPTPSPTDEKDTWRHAPPRHIPSRPATGPRQPPSGSIPRTHPLRV
jgi:hypothetical protein